MNRIIIIGNSGSGKTSLARKLSESRQTEVIHLDQLFWVTGGFNEKRPPEIVHAEIEEKKKAPAWIVEGVFGELAERFTTRADHLIWLDLPWEVCREGLLARGSESSWQLDAAQAEENFARLLRWAEEYWTRADLRSHSGHGRIFEAYPGAKFRIQNRAELELLPTA